MVVSCVCYYTVFVLHIQMKQKAGAPAAALMSRKELLNPFDSDEEEDDPYRDLIRAADQPADQSCGDITANTTELSYTQPTTGITNKTESGQYPHINW